MPLIDKCDHSNSRAKHHSWGGVPPIDLMFRKTVTLDPGLTQEAWDKLAVNTAFVEFRELPVRIHVSLVKALNRKVRKLAK